MKEILFTKSEADYLINVLNKQCDLKINKSLIKKIKNSEKKIKVSSAKGKGRNLQYWVCERIGNVFNIKFNQQDDNCPIHSREMGLNGTDVVLRTPVYEKFPFDVECKACETLSLPEWIRQARKNQKEGRNYLLVIKKQTIGTEPIAVMDWSTFEKLFKGEL